MSVTTINFRDSRTGNFQKDLTDRRGDMLMEAVTLHRRFPYGVLAGLFFLDKGAESDGTLKRRSTFLNAHARLRLFTGRGDPAGRDEQFERFHLLLMDANPDGHDLRAFEVGRPEAPIGLDEILRGLPRLVAERHPDFYELDDQGRIRTAS